MKNTFCKVKYFLLIFAVFTLLFLTGCEFGKSEKYKVEFMDGNKELFSYESSKGNKLMIYDAPQKEGYTFSGWDMNGDGTSDNLPNTVEGALRFVAIYTLDSKEQETKEFTVTFYDDDKETVLYEHKFKEGTQVTYGGALPVKENDDEFTYSFKSWSVNLESITQEQKVFAIYEAVRNVYTCTFMNGDYQISTYEVSYGSTIDEQQVNLGGNEMYVYTLIGWDIDGDKTPEEFPYTITKDTTFQLLYKEDYVEYTYTFYGLDSVVSEGILHYNDPVTYPEVDKIIATDKYYCFYGWDINDDKIPDENITIVKENIVVKALYSSDQLLIMNYNDKAYVMYLEENEYLVLYEEEVPFGKEIIWYTDNTYTNELKSHKMTLGNLNLYGRLEDCRIIDTSVLDCEYESITSVKNTSELQVLFDALLFNNVTDKTIMLEFAIEDTNTLISYLINNTKINCKFEVSSSYKSNGELTFEINYDLGNTTSGTPVNTQISPMNVLEHPNKRSSDFNGFFIESAPNSHVVKTSEQLFYCLECGYKPIIDPSNTDLVNLYEKIKNVLRMIIDDEMNDYQKTLAIYEWIIMNVTYDTNILNQSLQNPAAALSSHSFYLEGVFNDNLAVCDGISKAFVALANIEGITCVRSTGFSIASRVAHAWNKVRIDNKWYIVDATSGGIVLGTKEELMTHEYFLIPENEFSKTYQNDNRYYSQFIANNYYDYYVNVKYNFDDKDNTLLCNNIEEATNVLKWFLTNASEHQSVDMRINFDCGDDISEEFNTMLNDTGIHASVSFIFTNGVLKVIK